MAQKMLVAKYNTFIRHRDRTISNNGSKLETVYKPILDDLGRLTLKEDNKVNFYEMIQSHKASTDLATMIARYNAGDVNALNRQSGIFADLTSAPTSLMDFYNKLTDADNVFHQLPVEIQQEFHNNSFEFWNKIATTEGINVINKYNDGKVKSKQIDVSDLKNVGDKTVANIVKEGEAIE